jgi:PEGA domain
VAKRLTRWSAKPVFAGSIPARCSINSDHIPPSGYIGLTAGCETLWGKVQRKGDPPTVKKLLPVLLLFSPPVHGQTAVAVKSTPLFLHGEILPMLTDAPHSINILCRIEGGIRKRYLQVFVGLHNTSATTDLNFDPSGITLVARGAGTLMPMDAFEVRAMAKGSAHRQLLTEVSAAVLPDSSRSAAGSNNPDPQLDDRSRTDGMSDAAFAGADNDFGSIEKTNLLRTTIRPGLRLSGYIYFDMGKEGATSDSYAGYVLNIPVRSQTYAMDFSAADVAEPSAAVSPAKTASITTSEPATVVQINSNPDTVDIEVDGKFVGDTPSQLQLAAGDHTVRLTRDGLVPWEKKIHFAGGVVTINAEMKFVPLVHRVH